MVTKYFKKMAELLFNAAGNSSFGSVPVKNTDGVTRYLTGNFYSGFPYSVYTSLPAGSGLGLGIALGTGTTAPTADDYRIESPLTTASIRCTNSMRKSVDANDNPTLNYIIMVENISNASVTISEIAYVQSVHVSDTLHETYGGTYPLCLDRTLLASPITIAPGEFGTIRYELKCLLSS